MKKNGFTLIELLAVIAILAIILLIALPTVLNTITSSKQNAAKSSAQMAWEAAELYIAQQTAAGSTVASPLTIATLKTAGTGTLATDAPISAGSFTLSGTSITGFTVNLTVASGGTNYTCITTAAPNGTKSAITCS